MAYPRWQVTDIIWRHLTQKPIKWYYLVEEAQGYLTNANLVRCVKETIINTLSLPFKSEDPPKEARVKM